MYPAPAIYSNKKLVVNYNSKNVVNNFGIRDSELKNCCHDYKPENYVNPEYLEYKRLYNGKYLENRSNLIKKILTGETGISDSTANEVKTDDVGLNDLTDLTEESSILTSTAVFRALSALNWADRDERTMNENALHAMNVKKIKTLMPVMKKMADSLISQNEVTVNNALFDNDEHKYNFAFHIIAKGKNFFDVCMEDFNFALYIIDQYQPLYTFMMKKMSNS